MASHPFHPARSVSFPPRSIPNSLKVEECITKLRSLETSPSSSSSISGENIQMGMIILAELYAYVQDLIVSPSNQLALRQSKFAEQVLLDGSVGLIDTCTAARDLVLRLKEHVRDMQSVLRRKGCTASAETEARAYSSFRKKLARDVAKCLKTLKQYENKYQMQSENDEDPCSSMLFRVLGEVYQVTVCVFRQLYLFLSAKQTSMSNGWSLISRLVTKKSSSVEQGMVNEVAEVDAAICELHNVADSDQVQVVQAKLQALDASIRIVEGELECVSKCLVENRVSLLNILTH